MGKMGIVLPCCVCVGVDQSDEKRDGKVLGKLQMLVTLELPLAGHPPGGSLCTCILHLDLMCVVPLEDEVETSRSVSQVEELEWTLGWLASRSPLFLLSPTLHMAFLMVEMRIHPEVSTLGFMLGLFLFVWVGLEREA